MRNKNYKGRCEKRKLGKRETICKTYDAIQYVYADVLEQDDKVVSIRCNVVLEGLEIGGYMSDFACEKSDGEIMVRECVYQKLLTKPLTMKLLDASRTYWLRRGVKDWGIVIDE